jgi:hypothetical protein
MNKLLVLALVSAPLAAEARERGYLELGAGGSLPVAAGSYTDNFGLGPSVWAAAVLNPRHPPTYAWMAPYALELSFDWTFLANSYEQDDPTNMRSLDFDRYRILLGARYHYELREGVVAFARAAGGLEILAWEERGQLVGIDTGDEDAHLGVGLELGGGVRYQIGPIDLGGQLAVPMALHQHETYGAGVEVDHVAVDLELRVTLGIVY